MAGEARNGPVDRHQDGARLLRRRLSYLIHGSAAWSAAAIGDLWWLSPISSSSHRRALSSPSAYRFGFEDCASAHDPTMMGLWLGTSFIGNFVAGCSAASGARRTR